MEAGFMALRVLFLCSVWLILCLGSCSREYPMLNASDPGLSVYQDLTLWKGKPFSGTLASLYEDTHDTASIAPYLDGLPHGTWKKYYRNGRVQESRVFDNGIKVGNYDAWWEDGKPKLSYVFFDGEYEGPCREWNAEGTLIKEMNYHRGHEEGAQRLFYDNGSVRANYVVKNGRRYGLLGTKNCVNPGDSIRVASADPALAAAM